MLWLDHCSCLPALNSEAQSCLVQREVTSCGSPCSSCRTSWPDFLHISMHAPTFVSSVWGNVTFGKTSLSTVLETAQLCHLMAVTDPLWLPVYRGFCLATCCGITLSPSPWLSSLTRDQGFRTQCSLALLRARKSSWHLINTE